MRHIFLLSFYVFVFFCFPSTIRNRKTSFFKKKRILSKSSNNSFFFFVLFVSFFYRIIKFFLLFLSVCRYCLFLHIFQPSPALSFSKLPAMLFFFIKHWFLLIFICFCFLFFLIHMESFKAINFTLNVREPQRIDRIKMNRK